MIAGEALIAAVVYLIIFGLIFGILWWALAALQLPEPFGKVARVVLVLGAAFVCINILLGLAGHPLIVWGVR